jgi:hypothetical protein
MTDTKRNRRPVSAFAPSNIRFNVNSKEAISSGGDSGGVRIETK